MKCEDLLKALNEYVDGVIDPSFCDTFQKHLDDCNPCQVVVDTIRKTITLYKGQETIELPLPFKEKMHQALKEKWQERFPKKTSVNP